MKNEGKVIGLRPVPACQGLPFAFIDSEEIDNAKAPLVESEERIDYADVVMGGRSRLANDRQEFYSTIVNSPHLRALYDVFNNEDFVRELLKRMLAAFPGSSEALRIKHVLAVGSFDPMGAIKQSSIICRLRRFFLRGPMRSFFQPKFFLHFDVSSASNGYYRETHLDGSNRMVAGLVYFNFSKSPGATGGEFAICEPTIKTTKRQLEPEEAKVIKLIVPEPGMVFCFLNDSRGYHGVPLMEGFSASDKRYFCYFGISTEAQKHGYD
jgi:hypothetical protein